ncbi:MAG: hypothetical protein DCC75_08330, partial [Proteobacteria bacterium]
MSELEVKPNINQPGVSGLQDFGRSLAGKLAPNEIQERVRATPHGIFVEKDFTDKIAVLYAEWLKEKTGGEVQRSQAKCFKRLFGSLSPAWLYLVEAKCCLVGALVKIELPQPEILGLPAYRGTLDDTRRLLHPRDPLLQCMPHVTLHSCQGGLVFEVTLGRDRFRLDSGSIREFTRLTRNWRGGSESNSALREGFKGLITSLGEARPLLTGQSLLVPMRSEGFRFLTSGPLVFAPHLVPV